MKSPAHFFSVLGWQAQGDLGPITMYTSRRHKLVWFQRAPALQPPSPKQVFERNRWRAASMIWQRLTEDQRQMWRDAAKKAYLRIQGWNLFLYYQLSRDASAIQTIERQTGLNLLGTLVN